MELLLVVANLTKIVLFTKKFLTNLQTFNIITQLMFLKCKNRVYMTFAMVRFWLIFIRQFGLFVSHDSGKDTAI